MSCCVLYTVEMSIIDDQLGHIAVCQVAVGTA